MYHIIDPSYVGSYQLVSEPVNPNQRIQQHYAQYQQPLASPAFVPWQLPYPEVDPYQQQQTTHCQQYNFRSDWVFNFESGSKSEPKSREFANYFKCYVGRVTCCTSAISAADMSFIRDLLQQMIVSTDRIQASLEKMNLLLSESSKMFTDSFPWAVKSLKLQYVDVVACPKSFVRTISASDPAPPEKGAEVKKPKKDKISKLLLLPLKKFAADAKAKQPVAAAPKAKTPVNANQVHHYIKIYYFKFGSIDSINKLLGNFFGIISKRNAYIMFDIMLERNERKILKNMMFIFDPGGEKRSKEVLGKWSYYALQLFVLDNINYHGFLLEIMQFLHSQSKAMAGCNAVRSLLEKMTHQASYAYLGILERWVYEDYPSDECFSVENTSLQVSAVDPNTEIQSMTIWIEKQNAFNNTIKLSSEDDRKYFRCGELLGYTTPDRVFSYITADGKKSIIAPLRKAREHHILKADRPPHVTIICLVRDAAARISW